MKYPETFIIAIAVLLTGVVAREQLKAKEELKKLTENQTAFYVKGCEKGILEEFESGAKLHSYKFEEVDKFCHCMADLYYTKEMDQHQKGEHCVVSAVYHPDK